MRTIISIGRLRLSPGRQIDSLVVLDDDGYMWIAGSLEEGEHAVEADWKPIRGPGDAPPFIDNRSYLDRLEARIREQVEERDRLREHFDSLPKGGQEPAEEDPENVT